MEGDLQATEAASLIQVEGGGRSFVFDVLRCQGIVTKALKPILESIATTKVMHACQADCEALAGQFGVILVNVFDTQCAAAVLHASDRTRGINHILSKYGEATNTFKDKVKHWPSPWNKRPLAHHLLDYAAQDVAHLRQAYYRMRELLERDGKLPAALEASQAIVNSSLARTIRKLKELGTTPPRRPLPQTSRTTEGARIPSNHPGSTVRELTTPKILPPTIGPSISAAPLQQQRAASMDPQPSVESDMAVGSLALDGKADSIPAQSRGPRVLEINTSFSSRDADAMARTWTAVFVLSSCHALFCPAQVPCDIGMGQWAEATIACGPACIPGLQLDGFSIGRFLPLLLRAIAPSRCPERVGWKAGEDGLVNGEVPEEGGEE
mmetsp:Transcript_19482/g.54176  ORF Transcript_19482/g.54176 Transcript_19482/m.54176 type:complete len:381 (-) Transcript_19482:190-1332(-)